MPSQWEETFGRVQFEAAMNQIPICISACGGLQHYFCGNGVCVKDYTQPQAWQEAISVLDDPQHYNQAVEESCKQLVQGYSFKKQLDKFLESIRPSVKVNTQ